MAGFFSRLLVPRSVRHAMHPGCAVKRAVTPRAVRKARRALHPPATLCTRCSARSRRLSDQAGKAKLALAAWKLSGQPPEP